MVQQRDWWCSSVKVLDTSTERRTFFGHAIYTSSPLEIWKLPGWVRPFALCDNFLIPTYSLSRLMTVYTCTRASLVDDALAYFSALKSLGPPALILSAVY